MSFPKNIQCRIVDAARSAEIGDKAFGLIILAAFLVFLVHKPILQYYDDWTTPQPWFAASIDVEDHVVGQEAMVSYTRVINRPVFGNWQSNVFAVDAGEGFRYICSGGGYARYYPETSGDIRISLSDFVGAECIQSEGRYRVCSSYALRDESELLRRFGPFCTQFDVAPADEAPGAQ
ncbi:hypothetical protein [Pararhizobium haloflavum]|uniref:hypothetical protein n=1 Tax=Pararhizobium haloflavum TaxID=2037914 RepID=UPI000C189B6E|nr:hypothetical protein [Pararhizobium haloflavum]